MRRRHVPKRRAALPWSDSPTTVTSTAEAPNRALVVSGSSAWTYDGGTDAFRALSSAQTLSVGDVFIVGAPYAVSPESRLNLTESCHATLDVWTPADRAARVALGRPVFVGPSSNPASLRRRAH